MQWKYVSVPTRLEFMRRGPDHMFAYFVCVYLLVSGNVPLSAVVIDRKKVQKDQTDLKRTN